MMGLSLMLAGCMQAGFGDVVAPAGVAGEAQPWPATGDAGDIAQVPAGRMATVQIVDERGFGQPMVVSQLQVPAGWRHGGSVAWNDNAACHSGQMQLSWSAVSADGRTVFELIPGHAWQVSGTEMQTDPCPVAAYRSAREFLQAVVDKARPGSRVLDYSDLPDMVQKAEANMRQSGVAPAEGQRSWLDAGRMLIAYDADGIDTREVLVAMVSLAQIRQHVSGTVSQIASYRGPDGDLDFGLLDRMLASFEYNPQYATVARERVGSNIRRYFSAQRNQIDTWHARRMAEINARGEMDRARIRSQTQREIAAIHSATHANTVATNDNIHRRGLEMIGEYDSYAGHDGSTVQSSIHGGSRVFQDNNDPNNAWSTNDPYAQPSNATELERIR